MALIWLNKTDSSGKATPFFVKRFSQWAQIYLQVFGPATIYVSNSITDLTTQSAFGAAQGLQMSQKDGIKVFKWFGDLFISSSANQTPVEMVIVEPTQFGEAYQPIQTQLPEQDRQISYDEGRQSRASRIPWSEDSDDTL